MPRSLQEILDNADEYARRFEEFVPNPEDVHDATPLQALLLAVRARTAAEVAIAEAVVGARDNGISWAAIGACLATSGEAARQRYGHLEPRAPVSEAAKKPRKTKAKEDKAS